jgi:hypothetical protein
MGIKALQDELFRLRQTAGSNSANTEKIKDLEKVNQEIIGQLSVLNKDIGNLTKDNLETLEKLGGTLNSVIIRQKEQIAIQNQAVINLRNEFGTKVNEIIVSTNWSQAQIQKLWTAVEGFVSQESFSGLATKVNNLLYGLITLTVVVAVLLGAFVRHVKLSRRDSLQQSRRINQVENDLIDVRADQLQIEISEEDKQKVSKEALAQLRAGDTVSIHPVIREDASSVRLTIVLKIEDASYMLVSGIPRDNHDTGKERRIFRNTDILRMFLRSIEKGDYPFLKAAA